MLTPEDMKALQTMMETVIDEKLEPIKQDISNIKEDLAEVRGATNYIAEWVERVEGKVNSKAV